MEKYTLFIKDSKAFINRPLKDETGFVQRSYVLNNRRLKLFKAFGFHIKYKRELIITANYDLYSVYTKC